MVIKASAAAEIRPLIDALAADDPVRREAAIARLAIIGGRAVDRLLTAYRTATHAGARIAVLRALEAIGDHRMLEVARTALTRGGDEAIAGAAALRALLDSPHAPSAADSLDALMGVALDTRAERRLRLAAIDALQTMPEPVKSRIAAALADRGPALPADAWPDALDGRLPDDPAALRDTLQARAQAAAVTDLRKLIDIVRAREQSVEDAARRAAWRSVRGALHQALALRGSRVALYDLRETLEETAEPLPVSFLAALHVIGDASCVPALAAAHGRADEKGPWRSQVQDAFRAIVKREKITRRHAVMKRIAARWPQILADR